MVNKGLISLILVALLSIVVVNAIEELPKGSCTWTMPATEYREARDFQGVWGRFSDGSIQCFMPGGNLYNKLHPKKVDAPIHNDVVCEDPVCEWEKTTCKAWNYEFVCGWEGSGCHRYRKCDWEKTTCRRWNYEKICEEPVCK